MAGSVKRRGAGWQARADGPVDPTTGKRRQLSKQHDSKRDGEVWVAEQVRARETGTYLEPSTVTVRDYLAEWLASATRGGIAPNTALQYGYFVSLAVPDLGAIKLQRLGPLHIARWLTSLAEKDLSQKTIGMAFRRIKAAMAEAVGMTLISDNPFAKIKAPKLGRREMRCWDRAQVKAFLAAVEGTPLMPLWHLALATGMRRGELLGLRWRDVDLPAGRLTIGQGATQQCGHIVYGDTKTETGRRTLSIPAPIVAMLAAHRTAQRAYSMTVRPLWHADKDLVFTDAVGKTPWRHQVDKPFRAAIAAAGVPDIRFHDLRHSFASITLTDGLPVHIVARILGHASPSTTLAIYAHLLPSSEREITERIERLLYG